MLGPIFVREWLTVPRRPQHYLMRTLSLGAMWVLGLTVWQTTLGWDRPATLGDLARFGLLLFQILTFVQLVLLLFFSSITAAGSISQEKDRRTFVLLLLTDLRNYEIVLGKLFGSLLQIGLILAGMVPMFALLLLLGGIAPLQIVQALAVLAPTALAAGSLGCLIALWREKTFQVIALTFLFLILFLCLVHVLSVVPVLVPVVSSAAVANVQTWLEPFLALQAVLDPPEEATGMHPAYGFALTMIVLSVLLNAWGIWKLRVWNPSGEPIIQREDVLAEAEEKDRAAAHAAPGKARPVWANPVLWREIATRAYGRRPYMVKAAYFIVLAMIAFFAFSSPERQAWAAARGLVPVAIISLLLVAAQAVTSITTERDLGTLDLLLVTDLTPNEFIFGKLLGIIYNTKEYLLPPILLAAVYAFYGMLATPSRFHPEYRTLMNIESFVCVALGALVLLGFTIVLGVHIALRIQKSRIAIATTLGSVFFLSVGTLVCIYLILINGRFEYQWLSFSMFIFAGIGGMWYVMKGDQPAPSPAMTLASFLCPLAVFYGITNVLIGKPGLDESADPFWPFVVLSLSFSFAITAMMVPLLSEFDVALGRTSAGGT